MAYDYTPYPYTPPPGLTKPEPRHKVVIVGAGPIGLAMAIELANHGIASVVLDENNVVSVGSRAICWSKRALEILDRLGVGDRCVAKGVTWNMGRTFHGQAEVFNYDLLPEDGHKMPAFVNLQQYYVEEYLIDRAMQIECIDLRFKNKAISVSNTGDFAEIKVSTPDGTYHLSADYVLACDGANSPIRAMLGLDFDGELFEERFLIADIEMQAETPAERWFWFEPEFHNGQSALLHKQPDDIYRIDLQLGWDADPDIEKRPENVIPRIEKMVGHSDFRLDWVSVYTFQCRRLARFVQGRILFVGDSAHIVSPFGARGGNGGLQDVDNLGWKLAAVLDGHSPPALLETYNSERIDGADENILNSTRSTKFMTPSDGVERLFRDQVLQLAGKTPFARGWVNSGRLSKPCRYAYNAADDTMFPADTAPGCAAMDAPVGDGWLLNKLGGDFCLLALGPVPDGFDGLRMVRPEMNDMIRSRYLGDAGAGYYLIRPDQIIAARWSDFDANIVQARLNDLKEGRF